MVSDKKEKIILSIAYLPNIQYFTKLLNYSEVIIEVNDTFQKQSYRNRTVIAGANGPLNLVIPVKRPSGNSTRTKDVIPDYDSPWMQVHWKAIISAYRNSPFFEYYEPEIKKLFDKKADLLIEWNLAVLNAILNIAGIVVNFRVSDNYAGIPDTEFDDFRDAIHPKQRLNRDDPTFLPLPYYQVFSNKYGFIPNLSFIDLLFNEGPHAIDLCRQMNKKTVP